MAAAVSGVNGVSPYYSIPAENDGCCNAIIKKVVDYWNAFVRWFNECWTTYTAFGFWRGVEYIAPSWGPWLENKYLWITRIFSDVREITLQDEISLLRQERTELYRGISQLAGERNQYHVERDRLRTENETLQLNVTHLNETNIRLTEGCHRLQGEKDEVQVDLDTARRERDLLRQQVQPLSLQIQQLVEERNTLRQELHAAAERNVLDFGEHEITDQDGATIDIQAIQRSLLPSEQALFIQAFGHLANQQTVEVH